MREIDTYFLGQEEPLKSYLQALRELILNLNPNITEVWRYKMPFYRDHGKRFCYLWVHKKTRMPYIGIVDGKRIDHSDLIREKRTRMKILLLDPAKDIPVRKIKAILKKVLE